ncbi:MAG: dienelactone hydrolase family protein [Vicinamibacterales bacterium]
MSLSRRQFCQWLGSSGLLLKAASPAVPAPSLVRQTPAPPGSDIGTLYPFVQQQADRSTLELSFLRPEFRDLQAWQTRARATVLDHLFYAPPPVAAAPQLIRREDRGDYVQEYLTFQTTPDLRVPAYVLIPKKATFPAPGIVALHCHGGFYVWGKEKLLEGDHEHAALTDYKQELYQGTSIASELVRRGYVVIVIDAFYWGERRMLLDNDPPSYRDPRAMTKADVAAFNRRSQEGEQLVARSLFTAGVTWPGVLLWDDLRTVDYLASRPEVDPRRLGCVGLSLGGYRSFLLAALDPRIKVGVDVGWMTSFASQIKRHVVHTVGLTFHIGGLYRYLDLPDLAALIAPRALLVINGSKDGLFAPEGVRAAFDKIGACFEKAGVADRQHCRLYDAPHQFNRQMQDEAFKWLAEWLG